jgi:hypothetical protein
MLPALCLIVLGSADLAAQAAPGGVKVGDKSTVSVESSLDLEITIRDGLGENRKLVSLVRRDKYAQEVTEAAEGKAKSIRLKCLASTLQKSGTDTPIDEKPTALAGKSYLATVGADGWAAREPEGGAPPIEAVSLGAWNEMGRLLPAAEPKAGGSWTVDGKELLPVLFPMGLAEGAGKLDCVCEAAEGGKVTVKFKGTITGRARDENTSKLSLTVADGKLVYDLAKGRGVSLQVTGAVETVIDRIEVTRKAGATGALEEERRKIGEIIAKSSRMEASFSIE